MLANVVAAKDDINRNFLDPKFPKWSWQASQFVGFAEITPEAWDGSPTQLEWFDWSRGGQATIGFWDYTIAGELGPMPLYLSIVPGGQNLQFCWSGLGAKFGRDFCIQSPLGDGYTAGELKRFTRGVG